MIVKIAFKEGTSIDWWIYDNVNRVRFNYEEYEAKSEEEFVNEYYADLRLVRTLHEDGKTPAEGDTLKFVRLSWRDKENNEMVALFDYVAYLCNDEGKTIEKIPGPRLN